MHGILVWIRIRGSMPLTNESGPDADPDLDIFVIDLHDANKKLIKKKILHITVLFEGTFTPIFKDKV